MALVYPLDTPTSIGIENITIRSVNAVATSQSPFSYKQQVISHGGQRWEADISIPTTRRDLMAPWVSMLTALKGQTGTFLLSDPDYETPQGDVSSCVVTGSAGDETVSVVMTGTLKAGDYIQLGTASAARLHKVLQDQTGNGNLEIWPGLRANQASVSAVFNSAKGVFRLKNNITEYSINNSSAYGISFQAVEVIN